MTTIKRSYYDNGILRYEGAIDENGSLHGLIRTWHKNGVPEFEFPYDHGKLNGIAKQWNARGELLGSFEMINGTGLKRVWHENGHLVMEYPTVAGALNGRQIIFGDDGDFLEATYWIKNRKVSKKKYQEACEKDSTLPRYDDDKALKRMRASSSWFFKEERQTQPATPPLKKDDDAKVKADEFCQRLLNGPGVREALSWLEEHDDPLFRSVGEATDQEESIKFVKKLYRQGAVAVHAVEIDGEADEPQNTGKLVIELPQEVEGRKKLFKSCGTIAKKQGFDPETDIGQQYLFLMLD